MNAAVPLWAEVVVAALLVLSGIFVLVSAIGFVGFKDFFVRMHPPALAYTFGSWCVALGGVVFFSMAEARAALHPLLVIVMLCVTVPVTTLLLARVALFRRRTSKVAGTPPALTPPVVPPPADVVPPVTVASVTEPPVTEPPVTDPRDA